MKESLFTLFAGLCLLASCSKEHITKIPSFSASAPVELEKEQGKTKKITWCGLYSRNGTLIEAGSTCKGQGTECGRKDVCSARIGGLEDPNEVVFEDMTRQEFCDKWNTEEGMAELMEKGVYVVTEE